MIDRTDGVGTFMIPAYNNGLYAMAARGLSLSEFVGQTTLASGPVAVEEALLTYTEQHRPPEATVELIRTILTDRDLLAKTQVVSDRNWRNCVVLFTPSGYKITQGGIFLADGSCDLEATLNYWRRNAETVFLYLSPVEVPESERTLSESMEWLVHWVFKRYIRVV